MKWSKWLDEWELSSLKIKMPFAEMEFNPSPEDKIAAWEMYIELLTRITTQPLPDSTGDEATALQSIYSLFGTTRGVLKANGRHCTEFTKIAILVLNQKIRPFTAKWHGLSTQGAFEDKARCVEFRQELVVLQSTLRLYSKALADMAGVEDLTDLEDS